MDKEEVRHWFEFEIAKAEEHMKLEYNPMFNGVEVGHEKQIALACEKLNATREELNAMWTHEYYFDFMTWLCKVSGACAVWEKFIQCDKLTEKQIRALHMLKDNGLYIGEIPTVQEILKGSED